MREITWTECSDMTHLIKANRSVIRCFMLEHQIELSDFGEKVELKLARDLCFARYDGEPTVEKFLEKFFRVGRWAPENQKI